MLYYRGSCLFRQKVFLKYYETHLPTQGPPSGTNSGLRLLPTTSDLGAMCISAPVSPRNPLGSSRRSEMNGWDLPKAEVSYIPTPRSQDERSVRLPASTGKYGTLDMKL